MNIEEKLMAETKFDPEAEHRYYSKPVTQIRDYSWLDNDMRIWVPEYPDIFSGRKVLDIGAGEALQGILVCERYQPSDYVCLELVLNQMNAARTRLDDLPSLSLINGDTYRIPFSDSSFELVFGNGVLHHLPDLTAVASEVRRVLEPGGYYIGREPNFQNLLVRYRVLGGHHSENEYQLSPSEIRVTFAEAGLEAQIDFFWRRFPWIRWRFLAVSMRIIAQVPES
jgi:SAM-dependent methyltransferase